MSLCWEVPNGVVICTTSEQKIDLRGELPMGK